MPHDPRTDNPTAAGDHPEMPKSDVAPVKLGGDRIYPKVSIKRWQPDAELDRQIAETLGPIE